MQKEHDDQAPARPGDKSLKRKWETLTWDDLEQWAGSRSVSRGRAYERQGRVRDLVQSTDGRLLATVIGGDRYVVTVSLAGGKKTSASIQSQCTCPVGHDGCKHAVAVVAAYLDMLGSKKDAPIADDDARWDDLNGDDPDVELDEDEIDEASQDAITGTDAVPRRQTRETWDSKIKQHIESKNREELADLVWSLTQRFPELREEFRERISLGEGDVDRLITQARKELHHVISQESWRHHWSGEGNTPDYSRLTHRLERLVELGHADAVAKLGREIIDRGMEQVGRSNDEGELASELAQCLSIVFDAVAKSSMPPSQKLLFAIDAQLHDDYGVIGDCCGPVLEGKYQRADWSAVADELLRRLATLETKRRDDQNEDGDEDEDHGDFSRNYHRDRMSDWLADSLAKAGRNDEVLTVYEIEARQTGSYDRLVKLLIDRKQYDQAARWAAEGIGKTAESHLGIASSLAGSLCEIARCRKQWDVVAAHAAWQFMDRPGVETFKQLLGAAEKAGCQGPVHECAMTFLQTGIAPVRMSLSKTGERKVETDSDWPLPVPPYLLPLFRSEDRMSYPARPHLNVLIAIAIADKKPDDVLKWYDKLQSDQKSSAAGCSWYGGGGLGDSVAEAVVKSHPRRAIEIYLRHVNQNLAHASVSAYETVAGYLRRLRPVMKSINREGDWIQLVVDIRQRYANRPRFMEILDRLEKRPIIADQRMRG